MKQNIGFIGLGNMGTAIVKGILASNLLSGSKFYLYSPHLETSSKLHENYGAHIEKSASDVAKKSDIIFIGVKPNIIASVLKEIKDSLKPDAVTVSIAAGVTLDTIAKIIGEEHKIIRVMPNTPALVNEAICSLTPNDNVKDSDLTAVKTLLDCIGKTEVVPEYQIDAVGGASGSSPAFVFMFIEALADGAVKGGLTRKQAYKFAAQTVLGSAKLLLETGKHPGELKDMVCSPSGTTIEGVQVLEERGFRAAVMDAVAATIQKSKQMSGK
ncbi:pyrroline-5-carboxylate reductase [Orbaceae bacterium ESL0721]|nr:pyrroline-5-carboxylate reductase [Orbaceae bacterium ESL0721]